ncbi:MAG: endonuclease/exonuclease/phosphatase family protein [Pseudomonadota bacterium]
MRGAAIALSLCAALLCAASFLGRYGLAFDMLGNLRGVVVGIAVISAIFAGVAGTRIGAVLAVAVALIGGVSILTAPVAERPRAGDAPAIRLLTFNTLLTNQNPALIAAEIARSGADIVALQEASPRLSPMLANLEGLYPYQFECFDEPFCNLALLSKQPWRTVEAHRAPLFQHPFLKAEFGDGANGFTLVSVRMFRPRLASRYAEYYGRLEDFIVPLQGPVVLIGDMNAAPWSATLSGFSGRTGLRPVNRLTPTFPVWSGAGFAPIDNALVSADFTGRPVRRGAAAGSDHYPLIIELYPAPAR